MSARTLRRTVLLKIGEWSRRFFRQAAGYGAASTYLLPCHDFDAVRDRGPKTSLMAGLRRISSATLNLELICHSAPAANGFGQGLFSNDVGDAPGASTPLCYSIYRTSLSGICPSLTLLQPDLDQEAVNQRRADRTSALLLGSIFSHGLGSGGFAFSSVSCSFRLHRRGGADQAFD